MPILAKPPACVGCPLEEKGHGFAHPEGPANAPILFVGEALGKVEALTGRPFVGDAGGMLQRLLNLLGWSREQIRIANTISCRPPNDWFDERAPWYYTALNHCRYLDPVLAEPHPVVVTLGTTALKRVLGLVGQKKVRVQDFHGTRTRLPSGQIVVPTYHPSFLQRGAHNLLGTVLWDLQQAHDAITTGCPPDPATIVCDPPIDWFRSWVDMVVAARTQDPWAYPISSDVETPDKAGGRDEGEITNEDRSFQILRVNVACHPDEGITVPFTGPYIDELRRLHQSAGAVWFWNREYDFQRLCAAGVLHEVDSWRCVDLMWLWHVLQSDLPRGLGFVAPFYSSYGPWKHLATSDPVTYAAVDAVQNHRVGFGVIADLKKLGLYERAMRHTHELHTRVLRPAQLVGVKIDRQRLLAFKADLTEKARRAMDRIQACVPEAICPLTPKGGMKKKPLADILHAKATAFTRKGAVRSGKAPTEIKQELYAKAEVVEKLEIKEVLVCRTCGSVDVLRRHKCAPVPTPLGPASGDDGSGRRRRKVHDTAQPPPEISLDIATVPRWYWREPFNPDSPKQVLAYLKAKGHQPGKAKKTHEETTNRETLERLSRQTKDPFYAALLDYRAVVKVKGTYVEGTERRLDAQDRLHPTPTFKPSTLRLSYVDPNITNVVADKGGKAGLAAGFRACVVAEQTRPAGITDADLDRWAERWSVDRRHTPVDQLFRSVLVEIDFSAIEAVLTGREAGDREYMRLAQLGVHAALASYVAGKPYDPAWSDTELAAYFKRIKAEHPDIYDAAKRFIHGRNYGLTRRGMMLTFPHLFPTEAVAKKYEALFAQMAPKIPAWQKTTQQLAAKQHYLGGTAHPFGYRHWFWSVYTYRRLNQTQYYKILAKCRQEGIEPPVVEMNGQYFRLGEGEDAKRALAFFGQSTGAGVLKETLLRLLADEESPSYLGDAWFGQTPLRAPIHDSGLFEIPVVVLDRVLPICLREFCRPLQELPLPESWGLGPYLGFGIAAKQGTDWQAMTEIKIHQGVEVIDPVAPTPTDLDEAEELADLERVVA